MSIITETGIWEVFLKSKLEHFIKNPKDDSNNNKEIIDIINQLREIVPDIFKNLDDCNAAIYLKDHFNNNNNERI